MASFPLMALEMVGQRVVFCGTSRCRVVGPGKGYVLVAKAARRGSVTGLQPDRERKLMVIEIYKSVAASTGYCTIIMVNVP